MFSLLAFSHSFEVIIFLPLFLMVLHKPTSSTTLISTTPSETRTIKAASTALCGLLLLVSIFLQDFLEVLMVNLNHAALDATWQICALCCLLVKSSAFECIVA